MLSLSLSTFKLKKSNYTFGHTQQNKDSYMLINPLLLVQIFKDIENGMGMAPDVCENMVREGWAEWIDRTTGTPVDLNHPRSILCLTHEGQKRFAELTAL